MAQGFVEPGTLVYCSNCGRLLPIGSVYGSTSEPLCYYCEIKK